MTYKKCVKYSKAHHFADDTNMPQSGILLEVLTKKWTNIYLQNLSQCLKANKLSLNNKETELIFCQKATDIGIKSKLDQWCKWFWEWLVTFSWRFQKLDLD